MKYTPPPGSTDPDAPFVNGVPGLQKGSPVPAEAVEHSQREIVNVIKQAGLTPDDGDLTQLHQAINRMMPKSETFWLLKRLEANLTIYVNVATGNDVTAAVNNGTSNYPFKTISAALLYVSTNYYLGSYMVSFEVANGIYVEAVNIPLFMATTGGCVLSGESVTGTIISLEGDTNSLATVTARYNNNFVINNITVYTPYVAASFATGIWCAGGRITINDVTVRSRTGTPSSTSICIRCTQNGIIQHLLGTLTMQGNDALSWRMISVENAMFYFQSPLSFSGSAVDATIHVQDLGLLVRGGSTSSGTVAGGGLRYRVNNNGVINTAGGGENFFPGGKAGVLITGGIYA